MKISRLRRALAVFLSVMMLTLCAPMSAFTAFATGTVYVTDIISGGIGRKLYVGDVVAAPEGSGYTYNDTTYNFVHFCFENFPESGINEDMWMNESPFERFPIRGGTFTVSNSYMRSDISRTAGSYWELTEIQGVDSYLCLLFESDGANRVPSAYIKYVPENLQIELNEVTVVCFIKINTNKMTSGAYHVFAEKDFAAGKAAAPAEYTITFDPNDGTLPEGTESTATTTDGKLTSLPTPTREGYVFGGWYVWSTSANDEVLVDDNYTFTDDNIRENEESVTISAQWYKAYNNIYVSDQSSLLYGYSTGTPSTIGDDAPLFYLDTNGFAKATLTDINWYCVDSGVTFDPNNATKCNDTTVSTDKDYYLVCTVSVGTTAYRFGDQLTAQAEYGSEPTIHSKDSTTATISWQITPYEVITKLSNISITPDITSPSYKLEPGDAPAEFTGTATYTTKSGKTGELNLAVVKWVKEAEHLYWDDAVDTIEDGSSYVPMLAFAFPGQYYLPARENFYIDGMTNLETDSDSYSFDVENSFEVIVLNAKAITASAASSVLDKPIEYLGDVTLTPVSGDTTGTKFEFGNIPSISKADSDAGYKYIYIVFPDDDPESAAEYFNEVENGQINVKDTFYAMPLSLAKDLTESQITVSQSSSVYIAKVNTNYVYVTEKDYYYTFAVKAFAVTPVAASTEYTITLKYQDDKTADTTAKTTNCKLTSLPTPTRDGYTFGGWYTDATKGEKVDDTTSFDGNATIYAQWLDDDLQSAVTYLESAKLTAVVGDTTGTKYVFSGIPELSQAEIDAGFKYVYMTATLNDSYEGISSLADQINNELNNKLIPRRSSNAKSSEINDIPEDNTITVEYLSIVALAKINVNVHIEGNADSYHGFASKYFPAGKVAAPIEYTITLKYQDDKTADTTAKTTNGKLTSLPTPTRDGYTFKGWFDAETGGKEVTTATVFEQNTTIYAQWEKNVVYPALPKATATAGENSVSLKWTAVDGAKSYRVLYRVNGTEKWSAKNTTGTSLTVTKLTGGTKYDFLVLAYDGTNWSKYTNSDIINATPKTAAPAAPAKPAFTVTAGENSAAVKWTAVSGATSYSVFYRLNGTEKWTAKSTTGTSVTISGLTGGKKYDFLVRAYNGKAWSTYTNADIKTATVKAAVGPKLPVVSSITPYENSVVIRWSPSTGATSYRVYYRISGTTKWSYKNTTQKTMVLYELTGGKKYDFLVCAYNGKAWSAYTSQDIKNAVPVKATPKPAITSATPGKNSVTVKWTAVSGAKSYRVFYRVKGTSKWTTVNTTRTQATVSGLTSGKTYEILVRSYSASGWSSYSLKDYAEAMING